MRRAAALLVLTAALGVSACSSSPAAGDTAAPPPGAAATFTIESRTPLALESGGRRVALRVENGDSVLSIDGLRVVFQGHAGWFGSVTPAAGWVRIGRAAARWDAATLAVGSGETWRRYGRDGALNLFVDQSGAVGRSIFRD